MFDNLKNMAEQAVDGGLDPQAVEQAASDHVDSMNGDELAGHLQTASQNLQAQGQGDLASQASSLISQIQSNPAEGKDAVVAFIKNNPQVIQHFAPDFAQGLLSRIGL